jgi:hypothetical protein
MNASRLFFLVILGVAGVVGLIMATSSTVRPYLECDDGKAMATLGVLYDNRRLLHAVEVSGIRHQPMAKLIFRCGSNGMVECTGRRFDRGSISDFLISR